MHFVKLLLLGGFVYFLLHFYASKEHIWHSNSNQSITKNLNYPTSIPTAFRLEVTFEDDHSNYTHVQNGGTFLFTVSVNDHFEILSSGDAHFIAYKAYCTLDSHSGISGNCTFDKTISYVGNPSLSDLKENTRKQLVSDLVQQIN